MRICIPGATGPVGGETMGLAARAWPGCDLTLVASRARTIAHEGRSHDVLAASSREERDAPRGDLALVVLDGLRLGAATHAVRIASRWFESASPELQARGAPASP